MTMRELAFRETDVAAAVADWLEASGCEVYEEVSCGAPRADLVGVRDAYRVIVEVKTSLSWALIEQGLAWIAYGRAHHVYIASPSRPSMTQQRMLATAGLGILSVNMKRLGFDGKPEPQVRHECAPRFQRTRKPIKVLPEQRRGSPEGARAGTGGGFWTEWRGSMRTVAAHVAANPGCTPKEVITQVGRLHYSRNSVAVQCLIRSLLGRETRETLAIRVETIEGEMRLFPREVRSMGPTTILTRRH